MILSRQHLRGNHRQHRALVRFAPVICTIHMPTLLLLLDLPVLDLAQPTLSINRPCPQTCPRNNTFPTSSVAGAHCSGDQQKPRTTIAQNKLWAMNFLLSNVCNAPPIVLALLLPDNPPR